MAQRAHWKSKAGFILAAAGSAVGLGNIWGFPKVTADNGGGVFVMVYLACVVLIGLPVMTAEILLGRTTQKSPVSAMRALAGKGSPWITFGWMGVVAAFLILSFYSVIAGWSLHYTWLSLTGGIDAVHPQATQRLYEELYIRSPWLNLFWLFAFIAMVIGVVLGGVTRGVERWSTILMPALFLMLFGLLLRAFTLDGWDKAVDFVFGMHFENFTAAGALEALGQAFFSLSLGMGAILTYGSYLKKNDDIMSSAIIICGLDTLIAILAAMVLFPIIFTNNMDNAGGPGLLFITMPVALYKLPMGGLLAVMFFALLVVAALTSAISMLEVSTSFFIDEKGWSRRKATLVAGIGSGIVGIPSALAGGAGVFGDKMAALIGLNWFNAVVYLSNNFMLPLGGLGLALYTGWKMDGALRYEHFLSGSKLGLFFQGWLFLLKFVVPVGVVFVFLNSIGLVSF